MRIFFPSFPELKVRQQVILYLSYTMSLFLMHPFIGDATIWDTPNFMQGFPTLAKSIFYSLNPK